MKRRYGAGRNLLRGVLSLLVLFVGFMISGGVAQNILISENIQDWEPQPYGDHTQEIDVDGSTGTVVMTDVLVDPTAAASGTGSAGFAQLRATDLGILELPEVRSVSRVEFSISSFASQRSLHLERFVGSDWVEVVTFTGIRNVAQTYTHDVDLDEPVRFRLSDAGNTVKVHDIIIRSYVAAGTPQLFADPASISELSYSENTGPSDSESFELTAQDLDGTEVTLTATGSFELSREEEGDYTSRIALAGYDGAKEKFWVRLKSGLLAETYSGNIVISGGGAPDISVALDGSVTDPEYADIPFSTNFGIAERWDLMTAATSYGHKAYSEGGWRFQSTNAVRGTAAESYGGSDYSFRDRGIFTVRNIGEIDDMSGFTLQLRDWMDSPGVTRSINVSFDSGDSWTTVGTIDKDWFDAFQVYQQFLHYFEDSEDFSEGELIIRIDGGNETNTSRINIGQFQALIETDDALLSVMPATLSGFIYTFDEGPSEAQSFQVSGEYLDGSDVIVAAPANFEVSENETGPFGPEVTLTAFDGGVEIIWVRLDDDLAFGPYSGSVTISGGGADPVTVSLNGEVLEPILSGDMLVRYPIFGEGELEAFTVDNVTAEDLAISDGVFAFGSAQATTWQGPMPYAQGNGGWDVGNAQGAKYISISLAAEYGFVLQIDRIEFEERATAQGPSAMTILVNGVEIETKNVPNSQTRGHSIEVGKIVGQAEIRFAGWDDGSRETNGTGQWRVNDFKVFGTVEQGAVVGIAGSAGWRMLSVPVEGVTVADLAAQNQVQGIPGIAALYGNDAPGSIETAAPNIYTSYESGWKAPANVSAEIEVGKGLIWYLYNNDAGVSTPLPFTLSATGTSPGSDTSIDLHTSTESLADGEGGTITAAFNLMGNPFASDLDISGIAGWVDGGSLNSAIVQVWENDEAGWQAGIGHQGEWVLVGGGHNDNRMAAWQGFMLENDDAATIEVPISAKTDGATFLKEQKHAFKRLIFTLDGESTETKIHTRDAAFLVFAEDAEEGWDLLDATQLTPLAGSFATLSFVGERDGNEVLKVQESRPAGFEGRFEIPMAFNAHNMSGDFAIHWNGLSDMPSEWQVILTDLHTGQSVNLREVSKYTFSYGSNRVQQMKVEAGAGAGLPQIKPLTLSADNGFRFRLIVDSESLSTEIPGEVPKELEMAQNYPNPFNPATVIRYSVPEQAHIRLTVYDMLGREITVLVNEQKGPGSYDVNWDATEFSSGMYLYRLEAGNNSITRRMTFIK